LALTKVTEDMRTLGTGEVLDANIATDTISIGKISGSAAGAAGTFLKQDGTWATAGTVTDTTVIEDDIALLGFKVAVNGSLAKYNLVDQTEDAFMDATGIDASASTGEIRNAANYYSGVSITTPTASGGTVTTVGDYTIHSFLSGTTSYTNDTAQDTDILIVAGAGGGGGHDGAGAGAGGVRVLAAQSIGTAGATVVVGGGGGGVLTGQGGDGVNSSVAIGGGSTLTSTGGGGGGSESQNGRAGGSGGGGGQYTTTGGAGNAGSYSPVEGYAGANGSGAAPGYGGGGGGGASEVGTAPDGTGNRGHGGDGIQNNYRTGSNVYYGGGGGGAGRTVVGTGGAGGGGNGAPGATNGGSGTANTGGGGGGGGDTSGYGGAGGTGIVVLKRLTVISIIGNMTLQSNATTAESTATKGDVVMTYTNGAGTATLNTDLTAEFSADNGSNWTSMTLVAQGTTGSASPHIIVTAHDVTAGTSGTAMKYRIKTFNQSAAKDTRIQAVSLGWS